MAAFKYKIDAGAVARIAGRVPGDWDREGFRRAALDGLDALELKGRVAQVADALRAALPGPYPAALRQLLAGVPEAPPPGSGLTEDWSYWPLCTFVERHGLGHPGPSLDAMERLTPHWSCEFALRPYFAADPQGVYARLERWVAHPSVHLRRLVSEGTRPRLPWGARLRHRVRHPELLLPLLERLRDDPEDYVRRSVANHLNDIAKDHPELLLRVAAGWSQGAPPARQRLLKHALRTLLKAGDPRAYALIGLRPFEGTIRVERSPARVAVGEVITLRATLCSRSEHPQRLRLDLGVHFRLKSGALSPRVFRWTERSIQPGEVLTLRKDYALRRVSTRRLYPGAQAIDLRVNGVATEALPFSIGPS